MIDKRKKVFQKTFGLLLLDKGLDEKAIKDVFLCLEAASEMTRFYIENEVVLTVFNQIKDCFQEYFTDEGLDKVIQYLKNVRLGKFDLEEVTNE